VDCVQFASLRSAFGQARLATCALLRSLPLCARSPAAARWGGAWCGEEGVLGYEEALSRQQAAMTHSGSRLHAVHGASRASTLRLVP